MPKPENINSGNIKFLEIADHNGHFETYFKSSNRWYNISHDQGYILDTNKLSFRRIDKIILDIHNPKYYRIFTPVEYYKYNKMAIAPSIEHVIYDTKMGNPQFFYGEDGEKKITGRQLIKNFNKLVKELNR